MVQKNKQLKEEAKHCHSCIEWLHNCHAECCRSFRTSKESVISQTDRRIIFQFDGSDDMANYYRLHGGVVNDRLVTAFLEDFRVVKRKNHIYFYKDCFRLKNNKCDGWPDKRPDVCKNFNEATGEGVDKYVTPNCLCNYKTQVKK